MKALLKIVLLMAFLWWCDRCAEQSLKSYAEEFAKVWGTHPENRLLPFFIGSFLLKLSLVFSFLYILRKRKKTGQYRGISFRNLISETSNEPFSRLTKFDFVFLFLVTVLSTGLTFYKLGSRQLPETGTGYSFTEMVLDLQEASIGEVWLNKTHHHATLKFSCENGNSQEALFDDLEAHGWSHRRLSRTCSGKIRASLKVEKGGIVYELYLGNGSGTRVFPQVNCGAIENVQCSDEISKLFDEPNLVQGVPTQNDGAYFDESCHVKSGIRSQKFAEKGVAFFSHPFVGRDFISLSMLLFGVNPFAWRIPDAVAGALLPLLIFGLCWRVFKRRFIARVASIFTLLDVSRVTLSRIALTDSQLVFFMVLQAIALWEFWRSFSLKPFSRTSQFWLVSLGLALGAAFGTKWSGLFLFPLILVVVIWVGRSTKEKFRYVIILFICLVLIPIFVYVLGYAVWLGQWNSSLFSIVSSEVLKMWKYHDQFDFFNAYQSSFVEWPWVNRPIALFAALNGASSSETRLFYLGNPFLWWAILPSVFFLIGQNNLRYREGVFYLLSLFALSYFPWIGIERTTFLYHFGPIIPFGTVLVAVVCEFLYKKLPYFVWGYFLIVFFGFLFFLPLALGWPMPTHYFSTASWFPHWFSLYEPLGTFTLID